ncbi:MAG: hypothetical protein AAF213_08110 [Pseudomonadota bacterium]
MAQNQTNQPPEPTSPVPTDTSLKMSILGGLIWGVLNVLVVVAGQLLGASTSVVVTVISLISLYLAPLPLLFAGFAFSFDAALIASILVLIASIAFLDGQTAIVIFGGLCVPIMLLLIMHDYRFWRWRPDPRPHIANTEKSGVLAKIEWLYRPNVSHDRFRSGTWLTATALYFGVMLAIIELLLGGLGFETIHHSIFGSFNIEEMTPKEVQGAQLIFPIIELVPAGLAGFTILWIILSIKMCLLLIRFKRGSDQPRLAIAAGALPVWYILIIFCLSVVASQLAGQERFILGNMVVILAIPGLVVGLGVVHHLAGLFRFPFIALTVLYLVIMAGLQYWSLTVLTVMGFLDASLQIREWLSAKLGRRMEKKYA